MNEYRIIGTGVSGTVIYPCLFYDEDGGYDEPHNQYISKVMNKSDVELEYKNMNMLPDELNNILYYKFCKKVKLEEYDTTFVKNILSTIKRKLRLNDDALNMKYIEGEELSHVLDKYKNEDNQTNRWHRQYINRDNIPVITEPLFISLIESLYIFYMYVVRLNELGVYHNDLSETNIILTPDNKMMLIDFTFVGTVITSNNDISNVFLILNTILKMGMYNETISKKISNKHFTYIKNNNPLVFKNFIMIHTSRSRSLKRRRSSSRRLTRTRSRKIKTI
jgi:serine/threonine protein kinase